MSRKRKASPRHACHGYRQDGDETGYWPRTTFHGRTQRAEKDAGSTTSSTFVAADNPTARMMSSTANPKVQG